jgi:hypothetical protein
MQAEIATTHRPRFHAACVFADARPALTAAAYSLLRRGLLHGRRAAICARFAPMTTKRSKDDPLARSSQPRWLVLRDMFHNVLDSTELAPGADLRQAFASGLAELERNGWQSEGASGAMVFVRRGAERRLFAVHEHDPQEPLPAGHGAPAGRCLTCEPELVVEARRRPGRPVDGAAQSRPSSAVNTRPVPSSLINSHSESIDIQPRSLPRT